MELTPVSNHTSDLTKSDDCAAGVRFVYHEFDYRPSRTTSSLVTNFNDMYVFNIYIVFILGDLSCMES